MRRSEILGMHSQAGRTDTLMVDTFKVLQHSRHVRMENTSIKTQSWRQEHGK